MPEADINSVVDFINRILELSDLNLEASLEPVGEAVKIQVRGEDRALLLGHNLTLQISGGEVVLGQWQRILMAELDGPRARSLRVQLFGVS